MMPSAWEELVVAKRGHLIQATFSHMLKMETHVRRCWRQHMMPSWIDLWQSHCKQWQAHGKKVTGSRAASAPQRHLSSTCGVRGQQNLAHTSVWMSSIYFNYKKILQLIMVLLTETIFLGSAQFGLKGGRARHHGGCLEFFVASFRSACHDSIRWWLFGRLLCQRFHVIKNDLSSSSRSRNHVTLKE